MSFFSILSSLCLFDSDICNRVVTVGRMEVNFSIAVLETLLGIADLAERDIVSLLSSPSPPSTTSSSPSRGVSQSARSLRASVRDSDVRHSLSVSASTPFLSSSSFSSKKMFHRYYFRNSSSSVVKMMTSNSIHGMVEVKDGEEVGVVLPDYKWGQGLLRGFVNRRNDRRMRRNK